MLPSQLLAALEHVWSALEDFPQKAIAGGLAVSFWGFPRSTRDVDLAVMVRSSLSLSQLNRSLRSGGLREKNPSGPKSLGDLLVYQWIYEIPESYMEVNVDLLLGESAYFLEALTRSQPCTFVDIQCKMQVLSCEDLILFNLMAGRLIDLADIRELLSVNRDKLNLDYLQHQAARLGLHIPIEA